MREEAGNVLEREAARVLLFDDERRILLLQGRDASRPERGTWWFTPGGGLDPGESREEAARRELFEETGIELETLGPAVLERSFEFDFEAIRYRQHEVFFLARTAHRPIVATQWTEIEQRSLLGARWWTLDELDALEQPLYPDGLLTVVRALVLDPTRFPRSLGADDRAARK